MRGVRWWEESVKFLRSAPGRDKEEMLGNVTKLSLGFRYVLHVHTNIKISKLKHVSIIVRKVNRYTRIHVYMYMKAQKMKSDLRY